MPYFQKALMFADGHKGAAMQVYAIWWGSEENAEIPTDVTKTWSRKDRQDPGTLVFTRGDQTGTAKELIYTWAAENGKEPLA